jgi:hypothetical protein
MIPRPAGPNWKVSSQRTELFAEILRADPADRVIAVIELGSEEPLRSRRLRIVETIRRSPALSGLCRPIVVGATERDRIDAEEAGAYGFVACKGMGPDEKAVADFLLKVATRVPRNLTHSRGPFIALGTPADAGLLADDGAFYDHFRETFAIEPGPLDERIISSWAIELPDKVLVEDVGRDPESGWSSSAVSRRIEKLRDSAPVLFRDATGNLAKVRLARHFPHSPRAASDDIAHWPDVDRCITLSGDDELMRVAYVDDDARFALDSVIGRRMVEDQRRGGRPPAGSRLTQLAEDLRAAFDTSFTTRFADESQFRKAVRRALFAIADAQIDSRSYVDRTPASVAA